ncbi:MAG: hypothetical protein GC154_07910 [bacterium]|nr:hypothetical protein [bacterium]
MTETPSTPAPPQPPANRGEAIKAAMLSALVIPGAGQWYNRQWLKGTFVCLVFLIASLAVLLPLGYFIAMYYIQIGQNNLDQAEKSIQFLRNEFSNFCILAFSSIVLYIYSIWDAYAQALRKPPRA